MISHTHLFFFSKDTYPSLKLYRGIKNSSKGEYFGPFPNSYAVRKTLALLQKIFPIRQCEDSIYKNRYRPCLKYQINRCLGPCVEGLVSKEEYIQYVEYVRLFLAGKDDQVLTKLLLEMDKASQKMNFEKAAKIRNQIQAVRLITEKQIIYNNITADIDVIGVSFKAGLACINMLHVRHGKIIGSYNYFPIVPSNTELNEVIETFIGQFYLQRNQIYKLPREILLNCSINNKILIANSLSERAKQQVKIYINPYGYRERYLKLAYTNSITALASKLSQKSIIRQRLNDLALLLNLTCIKRIECFDVSHTMGEQIVASCVVFDSNGPLYSEYRCYNITGIIPGDDYAAISKGLCLRYNKEIKDEKIPDIILIDGGKNHLKQAKITFSKFNVNWNKEHPLFLGVAKNGNRKDGLETLFLESREEGFNLPKNSLALHIIQHIRNESHNNAINNHRKKWIKTKNMSSIERIKGIGPKRRQMLLKYMGGMQGLTKAKIEEIMKIPGFSQKLAEKIYYSLKS